MAIATGQQILAADALALVARQIMPTETLRNSNDTQKETYATGATKLKETKLNAALAAVRIKFDLGANAGGYTAYGQIYKNGAPIGTQRSKVNAGFTTYSEDFAGLLTNDLVQIYAWTSYSGNPSQVQNLRFYYSKELVSSNAENLVTSLELATDVTISVTNQDP